MTIAEIQKIPIPLIRATNEGKRAIALLADLGREIAKIGIDCNGAIALSPSEKKRAGELHYLRVEQLRRIEQRLNPAVSLKRDRQVDDLKIRWADGERYKTKSVSPPFYGELTECIFRGDTLVQIFHVVETGKREFSLLPDPNRKGLIPLWIQEWELSDYSLNFYPESFSEWAQVKVKI